MIRAKYCHADLSLSAGTTCLANSDAIWRPLILLQPTKENAQSSHTDDIHLAHIRPSRTYEYPYFHCLPISYLTSRPIQPVVPVSQSWQCYKNPQVACLKFQILLSNSVPYDCIMYVPTHTGYIPLDSYAPQQFSITRADNYVTGELLSNHANISTPSHFFLPVASFVRTQIRMLLIMLMHRHSLDVAAVRPRYHSR